MTSSFDTPAMPFDWAKFDADLKARAAEAVRKRHGVWTERLANDNAVFLKAMQDELGADAIYLPLTEQKRRICARIDLDYARERHYRRGFDPGAHLGRQMLRDAISRRITRGER